MKKGALWGAGFLVSLSLTAYGIVGGMDYVSNTEYQDIQNECLDEYMTSNEFVTRVQAKETELFEALKKGEITSEQFTYEYNELFDKMDAMMQLSKQDDELGERYREAMANENKEMAGLMLGAVAVGLGIVSTMVTGICATGNFKSVYEERLRAKKELEEYNNNPQRYYGYVKREDVIAQEEAERDEADANQYIEALNQDMLDTATNTGRFKNFSVSKML